MANQRVTLEKACYGLQSAAKEYGRFVAAKLKGNGWRRSTVERNVWFKPDAGGKHWSYLLIYVDNICTLGFDQAALTDEMNKLFYVKFHHPFGSPVNALEVSLVAKNGTHEHGDSCVRLAEEAPRPRDRDGRERSSWAA